MAHQRIRKDVQRANKADASSKRGVTALGKRIASFMAESKVRGNAKDYVLFVGDQMIDNWGQYTIQREVAGDSAPPLVVLVHKRDLWRIIGEDDAKRFWHRGTGTRTNYGAKRGRRWPR